MPIYQLSMSWSRRGGSLIPLIEKQFDHYASIALLEGSSDKKILERVAKRTGIEVRSIVGAAYCSGTPIAMCAATLAKLSRRVKNLAIVVDADIHDYRERAEKLINDLRGYGVEIEGHLSEVHEALFRISVNKPAAGERLSVLICVMGLTELRQSGVAVPLRKKVIEDHLVRGLLLENKIEIKYLDRIYSDEAISSKEVLAMLGKSSREVLEELSRNTVEEIFKRLIELLRLL